MNPLTLKELKDTEDFDPSVICQNTPFTQASFYGDWQKSLGRKVRRFTISSDKEVIVYFQIIKYPLVLSKSYLYIPYGPIMKEISEEVLIYFKQELQKIAKEEKAVFVRLDFKPSIYKDILSKFFAKAPLYTYHSAYFQPRVEWFLSLKNSEDEILMNMHEKTRYSIRLSERKEIVNKIITNNFKEYFEIFYELMLGTSKRNGFSLHPKEYYKNIFDGLDKVNSFLSISSYNDRVLAIDLIIVYGGVANYVFGGSSSEERNRAPTYSAQWAGICYAKSVGCTEYNFGGIAAENNIYKGWEGLTTFKKKFGGREMPHSDFFDIVINPLIYYLYNLRKRLKR